MTDIFKSADWAREGLESDEQKIVRRDGGGAFHVLATLPAGYTARALKVFGDYLCVDTDQRPLFYDSDGNRVELTDPPEMTATIDVFMGGTRYYGGLRGGGMED